MSKKELERQGWTQRKPTSYLHHCGAIITKKKGLWAAETVAGISVFSHHSAVEAALYLERNDPSFWSFGKLESVAPGTYDGMWFTVGAGGEGNGEKSFVCHLPADEAVPMSLHSTFKKFFFGNATCAKCSLPMASLRTQALCERRSPNEKNKTYVVCSCGHPVWRLGIDALHCAEQALARTIRSRRRKTRLRSAEGKHTPHEIKSILKSQNGRCIYCNAKFTKRILATKDHLLALKDGGTNWGLNLVMACRSCNSQRCDIPFRTYCKLLSPTQNKRILKHLTSRLLVLDFERVSTEELCSFSDGITLHEPRHSRFLEIQRNSRRRAKYVKQNCLLPPNLLETALRKTIKEQQRHIQKLKRELSKT